MKITILGCGTSQGVPRIGGKLNNGWGNCNPNDTKNHRRRPSQWTFENKWYLLEAEESFCSNDVEAAKTYYKKAITSAKLHKVRRPQQSYCSKSIHTRSFSDARRFFLHSYSLSTKKLWLTSWQRTSIWSWEREKKLWSILCWRMRSISSG